MTARTKQSNVIRKQKNTIQLLENPAVFIAAREQIVICFHGVFQRGRIPVLRSKPIGNTKDADSIFRSQNCSESFCVIKIARAVFSCKGIDIKDGITDSNELDSDIKNAMYACADTAILAVDSSKFDKVSFVKSMRLKRGDILVTDRMPSEDWQNYLQEQGVRLVAPKQG